MTIEETFYYNNVSLRYITASIMWRGEENDPALTAELMEAARELINTVSRMEDPSEEALETRKEAFLAMGEILYRKHSQRIMNGISDDSDVIGLSKAKEYCETVLPYLEFSEGKQFYQELDNTLLYLDILQFLKNITQERQYVEKWHLCASSAYEASKTRLQGDDLGRWYMRRLLNPIISAKFTLGDPDAGEALIPILADSGETAENIDMIKQAYQRKREELKTKDEKIKRKKIFGLF